MSGSNSILLSFGSSGLCAAYQIGIASYLQETCTLNDCTFSGVSGGGQAAVALALGLDCRRLFEDIHQPLIRELSNGNGFFLGKRSYELASERVLAFLDEEPDRFEKARERLYLSVTQVPSFRHTFLSNWSSNSDIVNGLVATSFVPILSGSLWVKTPEGRYIDGALSRTKSRPVQELPRFLFGLQRWRTFPKSWVFRTNEERTRQLFSLGREDARVHREEWGSMLPQL